MVSMATEQTKTETGPPGINYWYAHNRMETAGTIEYDYSSVEI